MTLTPQKVGVLFISNRKPKMTQTVTIDDIEYDLDKLSVEAKNQLVSLQFVEALVHK
jgi:hypothetical protein